MIVIKEIYNNIYIIFKTYLMLKSIKIFYKNRYSSDRSLIKNKNWYKWPYGS